MRVWLLGSGSGGNACLLECGDSRVLIDAGFSPRRLAGRLAAIGVNPASIEALVVTHEHGDHVKGACAGAARWGWAIHATTGTIAAVPALVDAGARAFTAGATLEIGAFALQTVRTPHDAAEPVAFIATARPTGARAGIATDMGHVSPAVAEALRDLDLLVLESNHDEDMLRAGPYPYSVQARIAGRFGHLSNRAAADLARDCVHPGLRHVVLAHLSEKCNDRDIAASGMRAALGRTRFRGAVGVAMQHGVVGPFTPAPERCVPERQLSLAF